MDATTELAAARHGCKVCGKSFLCGRSLGGHMRSHLSLGEAAAPEVDADDELRRASASGGRSCNGVLGYGLRENPRKTRRLSDFAKEEVEGDGDGDRGGDVDGEHKACRDCGKLFSSWRSLFRHMRSHASGGRDREDEEDVDVDAEEEFVPEDDEAEAETVMPTEPPVAAAPAALAALSAAPRRRRRSMRVAAQPPASPPVLSGFEKEQEDVALCLLMLSRDTGLWRSPAKEEPLQSAAKQTGLPRSGYACNSDDDSHSALLQYGGAKIRDRTPKGRKRSSPKQQREAVAPKRTRFECPGCGKVFSSYQALGGHRASHKRINTSCSAPKVAAAASTAPEPSTETETYTSSSTLSPSASPDSVVIGFRKSKARAVPEEADNFECTVCFRVFASEQALGEHEQSHLMAVEDDQLNAGGADQEQHPAATAGFLDLNFPPAPPEEA
ncbi:hypothetical protein BS78_02G339500 [Paspalum vaginatum]|nr:hypothetical protein BS78_02G339500 [Paspalum vaginatum]